MSSADFKGRDTKGAAVRVTGCQSTVGPRKKIEVCFVVHSPCSESRSGCRLGGWVGHRHGGSLWVFAPVANMVGLKVRVCEHYRAGCEVGPDSPESTLVVVMTRRAERAKEMTLDTLFCTCAEYRGT